MADTNEDGWYDNDAFFYILVAMITFTSIVGTFLYYKDQLIATQAHRHGNNDEEEDEEVESEVELTAANITPRCHDPLCDVSYSSSDSEQDVSSETIVTKTQVIDTCSKNNTGLDELFHDRAESPSQTLLDDSDFHNMYLVAPVEDEEGEFITVDEPGILATPSFKIEDYSSDLLSTSSQTPDTIRRRNLGILIETDESVVDRDADSDSDTPSLCDIIMNEEVTTTESIINHRPRTASPPYEVSSPKTPVRINETVERESVNETSECTDLEYSNDESKVRKQLFMELNQTPNEQLAIKEVPLEFTRDCENEEAIVGNETKHQTVKNPALNGIHQSVKALNENKELVNGNISCDKQLRLPLQLKDEEDQHLDDNSGAIQTDDNNSIRSLTDSSQIKRNQLECQFITDSAPDNETLSNLKITDDCPAEEKEIIDRSFIDKLQQEFVTSDINTPITQEEGAVNELRKQLGTDEVIDKEKDNSVSVLNDNDINTSEGKSIVNIQNDSVERSFIRSGESQTCEHLVKIDSLDSSTDIAIASLDDINLVTTGNANKIISPKQNDEQLGRDEERIHNHQDIQTFKKEEEAKLIPTEFVPVEDNSQLTQLPVKEEIVSLDSVHPEQTPPASFSWETFGGEVEVAEEEDIVCVELVPEENTPSALFGADQSTPLTEAQGVADETSDLPWIPVNENGNESVEAGGGDTDNMGNRISSIFDFRDLPLERFTQQGGKVIISEDGEYAIIDFEGKRKEYKVDKEKLKRQNKSVLNKTLRDSKDLSQLFDHLESLDVIEPNKGAALMLGTQQNVYEEAESFMKTQQEHTSQGEKNNVQVNTTTQKDLVISDNKTTSSLTSHQSSFSVLKDNNNELSLHDSSNSTLSNNVINNESDSLTTNFSTNSYNAVAPNIFATCDEEEGVNDTTTASVIIDTNQIKQEDGEIQTNPPRELGVGFCSQTKKENNNDGKTDIVVKESTSKNSDSTTKTTTQNRDFELLISSFRTKTQKPKQSITTDKDLVTAVGIESPVNEKYSQQENTTVLQQKDIIKDERHSVVLRTDCIIDNLHNSFEGIKLDKHNHANERYANNFHAFNDEVIKKSDAHSKNINAADVGYVNTSNGSLSCIGIDSNICEQEQGINHVSNRENINFTDEWESTEQENTPQIVLTCHDELSPSRVTSIDPHKQESCIVFQQRSKSFNNIYDELNEGENHLESKQEPQRAQSMECISKSKPKIILSGRHPPHFSKIKETNLDDLMQVLRSPLHVDAPDFHNVHSDENNNDSYDEHVKLDNSIDDLILESSYSETEIDPPSDDETTSSDKPYLSSPRNERDDQADKPERRYSLSDSHINSVTPDDITDKRLIEEEKLKRAFSDSCINETAKTSELNNVFAPLDQTNFYQHNQKPKQNLSDSFLDSFNDESTSYSGISTTFSTDSESDSIPRTCAAHIENVLSNDVQESQCEEIYLAQEFALNIKESSECCIVSAELDDAPKMQPEIPISVEEIDQLNDERPVEFDALPTLEEEDDDPTTSDVSLDKIRQDEEPIEYDAVPNVAEEEPSKAKDLEDSESDLIVKPFEETEAEASVPDFVKEHINTIIEKAKEIILEERNLEQYVKDDEDTSSGDDIAENILGINSDALSHLQSLASPEDSDEYKDNSDDEQSKQGNNLLGINTNMLMHLQSLQNTEHPEESESESEEDDKLSTDSDGDEKPVDNVLGIDQSILEHLQSLPSAKDDSSDDTNDALKMEESGHPSIATKVDSVVDLTAVNQFVDSIIKRSIGILQRQATKNDSNETDKMTEPMDTSADNETSDAGETKSVGQASHTTGEVEPTLPLRLSLVGIAEQENDHPVKINTNEGAEEHQPLNDSQEKEELNENPQEKMKRDSSLFSVLNNVCNAYSPPKNKTAQPKPTQQHHRNISNNVESAADALSRFEVDSARDDIQCLQAAETFGMDGISLINDPLPIQDQSIDSEIKDALLLPNTARRDSDDTLDVTLTTISDSELPSAATTYDLTHVSLIHDPQLDKSNELLFYDSSDGSLHITSETTSDTTNEMSELTDVSNMNTARSDVHLNESLVDLVDTTNNPFSASTPRSELEQNKTKRTIFEEIVETRTEIVVESEYEVKNELFKEIDSTESQTVSLLIEEEEEEVEDTDEPKYEDHHKIIGVIGTVSSPIDENVQTQELSHEDVSTESQTVSLRIGEELDDDTATRCISTTDENVQGSSQQPVIPIIVESLIDATEESTVEEMCQTLDVDIDVDLSHHSLVEGDMLDTTSDLKEAVISEQSEPVDIALLAEPDGAEGEVKRRGTVGRSDSWKFSSDYKLSRSSQSLIESIELDMEDETLNDFDPNEEDDVDPAVQEMIEIRANLRHVDSTASSDNKKPTKLSKRYPSENNLLLSTSSTTAKMAGQTRRLKPKDKGRRWKSRSLHNIFSGDGDLETDIDSVDDKELLDVLKSPKLKEKTPDVCVTDVDKAFTSAPTTPNKPRKFVVVSRKSNIRKYSYDNEQDDLQPGLQKRCQSLDQKLKRPLIGKRNDRKEFRKSLSTGEISSPAAWTVVETDRPFETDIDNEEDDGFININEPIPMEVSITPDVKSDEYKPVKILTSNGNRSIEPIEPFETDIDDGEDFANIENMSPVETPTASITNNKQFQFKTKVEVTETQATENKVKPTFEEKSAVQKPVSKVELPAEIFVDINQESPQFKINECPPTTFSNSPEETESKFKEYTKKTKLVEEEIIPESQKFVKQYPSELIDRLMPMSDDDASNNNNDLLNTQKQNGRIAVDEPVAKRLVKTSLNLYHIDDRDEGYQEQEIIVTVSDDRYKATIVGKDVDSYNTKNKLRNNRDSWDILALETSPKPPDRKVVRKDIEQGEILRETSIEKKHIQKHQSWNILDLNHEKEFDPLAEFFNNAGKMPEKKRPDSSDISYLFEQYQREREALQRVKEKSKRNSVGSLSDFSEISSLSEDESSRRNSWYKDVLDVDEPELSHTRATTHESGRLFSLHSPNMSPRDSAVSLQQCRKQTEKVKGSRPMNPPTEFQRSEPSINTMSTFSAFAPVLRNGNDSVSLNYSLETSTETNKNASSPLLSPSRQGKLEETVIKPLPTPVKPDFVPQVSTFSEEDLGSMVMAQAVSAVRKRRGGRVRRNVNAEQQLLKQEEQKLVAAAAPPKNDHQALTNGTENQSLTTTAIPLSPPKPPRGIPRRSYSPPRDFARELPVVDLSIVPLSKENMQILDSKSPELLQKRKGSSSSSNSTITAGKSRHSDKEEKQKQLTSKSPKSPKSPKPSTPISPKSAKSPKQSTPLSQKAPKHQSTPKSPKQSTPKSPNQIARQSSMKRSTDSTAKQQRIFPRDAVDESNNTRSYDYVNSMPDIYNTSRFVVLEETDHVDSDFHSEASILSDIGLDSCFEGSVVGEQLFVYPSMHMNIGDIKSKPGALNEYTDSSGDESFTTEQTDRFKKQVSSTSDTERTVYCGHPPCSRKQIMVGNEKSRFISCNSCFTCYCSKTCKRMHWVEHRKGCFFGRINLYVKTIVRNCEREASLNTSLRNFALKNYKSHGRGCLMLAFSSPSDAKEVTSSNTKELLNPPTYSTISNILKKNKQSKHSRVLCQSLLDYDPEQEFVINISIRIGKTRTSAAKKRTSNVVRCARISSLELTDYNQYDKSLSSYYIRTFCLPRVALVDYMNDVEVRRYYCKELSFSLKRCGVRLKLDYPEAYEKLSRYVQDEKPFLPIVLYGQKTGRNYKCILHQGKYNASEEARGEGVLV